MRQVDVYVDGSYNKARPGICKGALIVVENDKPLFAQNYTIQKENFASMNNVGGELWAAMSAIPVVKGLFGDEDVRLSIYHDYKGIRNFITGPEKWTPSKPATISYAYIVQQYMKEHPASRLNFVKVKAHSGIKWNEAVDKLTRGEVTSDCEPVYKGHMLFKD